METKTDARLTHSLHNPIRMGGGEHLCKCSVNLSGDGVVGWHRLWGRSPNRTAIAHMNRNHPLTIPTLTLLNEFNKMDILELIHLDQTTIKPFRCEWHGCSKAFARRSDLARHWRIHNDDRPYKCCVGNCDKKFIQRSALTVHLRTHTGERPHCCEHCDKRFSDSSSLARHRRIHTGPKPYRCEIIGCEKAFARKSTLTLHRKMHQHFSADFLISECNRPSLTLQTECK
ncbi:uncharacterized protein VTP21DRAFT_7631 [Calcarisporiella thermophila]|uniref:uncharacterized protein n=1 Tax=Calcarisporiella thermophila TaxID=911321 RepID=UPI00374496AA